MIGEGLGSPSDEIIGTHQQRRIGREPGELCPPTVNVSDVCVGSDEVDLDRHAEGHGHLVGRGHPWGSG